MNVNTVSESNINHFAKFCKHMNEDLTQHQKVYELFHDHSEDKVYEDNLDLLKGIRAQDRIVSLYKELGDNLKLDPKNKMPNYLMEGLISGLVMVTISDKKHLSKMPEDLRSMCKEAIDPLFLKFSAVLGSKEFIELFYLNGIGDKFAKRLLATFFALSAVVGANEEYLK